MPPKIDDPWTERIITMEGSLKRACQDIKDIRATMADDKKELRIWLRTLAIGVILTAVAALSRAFA